VNGSAGALYLLPPSGSRFCLQVIPKPHPWLPACAGMTLLYPIFVILAKAGIQVFRLAEV
jgi:hypothetical protein